MTERYTVEVNEDGTFWFKEGTEIRHRIGGPAVEYPSGTKEWYLNGKRSREDGPAIEFFDGSKEWFLNGVWLTEEKWKRRMNLLKIVDTSLNGTNKYLENRIGALESRVKSLEEKMKPVKKSSRKQNMAEKLIKEYCNRPSFEFDDGPWFGDLVWD